MRLKNYDNIAVSNKNEYVLNKRLHMVPQNIDNNTFNDFLSKVTFQTIFKAKTKLGLLNTVETFAGGKANAFNVLTELDNVFVKDDDAYYGVIDVEI